MKIPENLNTLQVEAPEPHLWIVRFNRPEVLNALGTRTSEDLRTVFGPLAFTPGDLRCIVLTGAGDRAFCAGADLKERNGMTDDAWRRSTSSSRERLRAAQLPGAGDRRGQRHAYRRRAARWCSAAISPMR